MKLNFKLCRIASLVVLTVLTAIPFATVLANDQSTLTQLLKAPYRTQANVVRDVYRHPIETLTFFGVKDSSTVVEILPGSRGYYLEILAPYLKDRGVYIAANRDENAAPRYLEDHQKFLARLKEDESVFAKVKVTKFNADRHDIAPAGSADFVLTFRNLHNWLERNEIDGALRAFHKALKPGGVLGVVDHRGRTDLPQEAQMKFGYVREDVAIKLIEKAGFKLAATSPVNNNPKDTKDYPDG
ncbi:MAG TPA: methyltransferase domain-containing protein, partial [Candidatus Binatia bacterium]|nr:methyltransferase domain-containing protein [Candidatus Binatia bacterium]